MNEQQFKHRTKPLALRVIRMVESLPLWEEILAESGLVPEARLADLINETRQITAMTVTWLKTLRARSCRLPKNQRT